jgi:uncharacterized protein YqgC (DUF456 family)
MPVADVLGHGLLFGIAVGVMALGLAGIVLPVLPGLVLIWLAAALYGVLDQFTTLDLWTFAFITTLALLGEGAQLLGGQIGVRLGGASRVAGYAAVAGGVLGFFVFPPFGMILFAALAVFLAEFFRQRRLLIALRSSAAWLAGWLAGIGMQLVLAFLMIVAFIARVLISVR